MRLALGTVQFGLSYGVANQTGRPTDQEVSSILDRAHAAGVRILDTAIGYGDAEAVLGRSLRKPTEWRIVTKLPRLPVGIGPSQVMSWVDDHLRASRERLRTATVDAVLLHYPDDLLGPAGAPLRQALSAARASGRTRRLGVSVYGPDDLDRLFGTVERLNEIVDVVQVPYNVFDRSIETSGWVARLVREGIQIHLRSVFLQGLLLMDTASLPEHLRRFAPSVAAWQAWLEDNGQAPVAAALRLAMSRSFAEVVIVGTEKLDQLDHILSTLDSTGPVPPETFITADPELRDPRQWTKQ